MTNKSEIQILRRRRREEADKMVVRGNPPAHGDGYRVARLCAASRRFAVWVLGLWLLSAFVARAALVSETATEFLTSGYFNSDTNADVLVLDKATGIGRVGYQDGAGALIWSEPLITGVENVTGCAIGKFLQTTNDNLAVTSTDYNRVPLIDLSNTNSASTPFVVTPIGIGPHTLVGLARPIVPPPSSLDSLLAATAFNSPIAERLELIQFSPGPITSTVGPTNETGFFERGNALQLTTNGPTFAAGLVRGDTNDTLHLWQFTNAPGVIATLSNLPPGSDFVFGKFDGQALPHFWFYVPGQSNVTIRPLIASAGGFDFGPAIALNFAQAVQNIYYVAQGNDGSAFIRFGDSIQGVRLPGGSPQLAAKYSTGGGDSGNVFTGIAELDNGKFALFSAPTGTMSSLHAQVMTFDGTNYTQISSSDLPAVLTRNTRATVWLFQSEPFTNSAATLISSTNVPDWSSGVLGLPGSLSVRVENDSGASSGLGNPATTNLGAPPAGTTYALPDQYRDDISFFIDAPPRPAEPVIITISPPPGSYGGPIQISFIKQTAAHQVFYRVKAMDTWQLYSTSFPLTNDATIQYYGNIPAGTRGRLQFASYTMGRAGNASEPPVKLPGSPTNTPPNLNTNFLQLSANGTIFYSRLAVAPGTNDSIWAINLDGTGETFITEGARPRVSRDGQWMAFLREGGAVTAQGNLWVRNLATRAESRVFTNTDSIMGFDWNGTNELVFDNNCVLLRQPLNGPVTQLPIALTPQCLNGAPVVNPIDHRLAFHNLSPSAAGVYLTPPNWSSRTNVTEPSTLRLRWPGWSFDGSRLVMADRISSAFINTGLNLWTAASDGSNLRQITALTEPAGGFPHGAIWTPSGSALVGAGRIGGTNGLWVITLNADGCACEGPPRLLPTSAGSEIDFAGSIIVSVIVVNHAPTLDPIPDPAAIPMNSGAQTVNLSGISAGPNESQTLTITATSGNTALIPNPTVTYTSPNATGSLSYTPVANQSGSALITVTVTDNGGTANGGVNTTTRTFTVNVTAVNSTLDFGDAPAAYPTLLVNNGARHVVPLGGATLYLSAIAPDIEADGLPDSAALGDNNSGLNDEDGVLLPAGFTNAQSASLRVIASGTGKLDAWIDFNRDGDWSDAGEQIITNLTLVAGTNLLSINPTTIASNGTSFARFRFSSVGNLAVTGQAADGEVEDYQVTLVSVMVVNRNPVVGNDTLGTVENTSVAAPKFKLLVNDSDPDGDSLTITAASATSTNGGAVTLNANNIIYAPVSGFSGQDTFTYTVGDGRGGSNTATVVVTVRPANAPSDNEVSITPTANGKLIRYAGIPGQNYIIQKADFVIGPYTDLSPPITTGPTGVIEYEDTTFPVPPIRFYRTIVAP